MSQPDENIGHILASSATSTTLLIAIQLASKLFTFISNQLILRKISPATFGIAARLELCSISILYLSRESIRIAIQRQPLGPDAAATVSPDEKRAQNDYQKINEKAEARFIASQSVVNMSYLSVGMGIPLAMAFATSYMQSASENPSQAQFYKLSVMITTIASLMELCTEPFFAVVQQHMLYKKRAAVEMAAVFVKTLAVCGSVVWAAYGDRSIGVLPFALGHLCYSFALICGYSIAILRFKSQCPFSLLPKRISSRDGSAYIFGRFPRRLVALCANIFLPTFVKYLLTEGDSVMLTMMTTGLEDQGIYSLASNYGGLIARILFQPIEESSRTFFSSLLNSRKSGGENYGSISVAKIYLTDILRAYGLLSILVLPLGPYLVPRVLQVLGGQRWASSDVHSLFSLYCYYIPFLAFNGIAEAFVSSAASPSELRRQAGWMGVFSVCFVLAAYLFLIIGGMGARGIVWANIVNLAIRIAWSFVFIRSYLSRNRSSIALGEFGLRPYTLIAGAIAWTTLAGKRHYNFNFHEIVNDFAVCTMYTLLVLFLERKFVKTQIDKGRRIFGRKNSGPKIK